MPEYSVIPSPSCTHSEKCFVGTTICPKEPWWCLPSRMETWGEVHEARIQRRIFCSFIGTPWLPGSYNYCTVWRWKFLIFPDRIIASKDNLFKSSMSVLLCSWLWHGSSKLNIHLRRALLRKCRSLLLAGKHCHYLLVSKDITGELQQILWPKCFLCSCKQTDQAMCSERYWMLWKRKWPTSKDTVLFSGECLSCSCLVVKLYIFPRMLHVKIVLCLIQGLITSKHPEIWEVYNLSCLKFKTSI